MTREQCQRQLKKSGVVSSKPKPKAATLVAQLVERRMVIERLMAQCSNRAFLRCVLREDTSR